MYRFDSIYFDCFFEINNSTQNIVIFVSGYYQVSQYHKVLAGLYQKYGPLVRQNFGSNPVVHVFEPDDIKTVYMSEGTMPHVVPLQETVQVFREQNKLSPGLGNINGEEWYKLRSAIRKMILRPKEVHYYLPFVNSVAMDFVKHINKKKDSEGVVNGLKDEVAKWSQESAGMVCFEERLGCMDDGPNELRAQKMVDANKLIFELSGQLKFSLPIYKYISTPKWRQLKEAEEFVYSTTVGYVTTTITKLQGGISNNKYTFMAHLLGREELTRNDVTVLTLSLFADGLSTTVPVLIYNLYCLATNPEAQNKAYNEISSATRKGEEISSEILNSFSYLKAIIKETFRLFPNGTEVSRIIQKDLVLSGYQVPAGVSIL
uniref:Cytochrome P450 n=1 Tax=Timema genevievae TaxID=629358 RepID=A0A7R9PIZ3_TIMGE|nr:unnamed protein product [Timema genevievae]